MFRQFSGRDIRLVYLDDADATARGILRASKRAALARMRGDRGEEGRATAQLCDRLSCLNLAALARLAVCYMVSPRWCAATGAGGIWAVASEIVNAAALAAMLGELGRERWRASCPAGNPEPNPD